MAKLQEMGEFVRSASSTIEAPVVRRLKEAFAAQQPKQARASQTAGGRSAAAPVAPAVATADDGHGATNGRSPAAPAAPAAEARPAPTAVEPGQPCRNGASRGPGRRRVAGQATGSVPAATGGSTRCGERNRAECAAACRRWLRHRAAERSAAECAASGFGCAGFGCAGFRCAEARWRAPAVRWRARPAPARSPAGQQPVQLDGDRHGIGAARSQAGSASQQPGGLCRPARHQPGSQARWRAR